jgi:hypothetical protein
MTCSSYLREVTTRRLAASSLITVLTVTSAFAIPLPSAVAGEPTWQPIPKAPIPGRIGAGVVWSGDEMIVWGGVTRDRTIEARADGAAFDPVRERWRGIAMAPRGVIGGGGQAAAWTGRRALFWAGNSPDGPARGAVYNPETDRWRRLHRGPLGPREGYVSAWTGSELLVIGGTSGDALARPIAAAVDPRTDSWRRLPALNRLDIDGLQPRGAVWTGDRVFISGLAYECPDEQPCTADPIFLAYDLEADEVSEIDLSSAPAASITAIGWTGSEVFATGEDAASVVLYDPSTETWRTGAVAPCAVNASAYRQTAWLEGRYVATCGREALQIYDVGSDDWETIAAGRSPFNSRAGSAIAWTGEELIVWSGATRQERNPTPNSGMSIELST